MISSRVFISHCIKIHRPVLHHAIFQRYSNKKAKVLLCNSFSPFHNTQLKVNCSDRVHISRVRGFTSQIKSLDKSVSEDNEEIAPDIAEICQGNNELEKKLRILMLEVDIFRQEGKLVPNVMQTKHWIHLLSLPSRSQRDKYLVFLFKIEQKNENDKKRKEEKRAKRLEELSSIPETDHLQYGFHGSTIFLRVYNTTMDHAANAKLIQAMQFSQHMVVDCSYEEFMTLREKSNCAKQLMLLFAENRSHEEPFHIQYCNAYPDYKTIKELHKFIPKMYEDSFPLHITEKSYLDLYPKEQLVYLTPHCRTELAEYDHDAVYIIGAMVDKCNNEPLSLAKAKKEGLKMAKFPLDKYLLFNSGSGKSLTINQVLKIMLDMRRYNNWDKALGHVPKRKLYMPEREFNEGVRRQPRSRNNSNNFFRNGQKFQIRNIFEK